MIVYRHPTETQPPEWLAGAYTRAEGSNGPIFTRSAPGVLVQPVDVPWHDVEGGWQVAEVGDTDPATLLREWVTLDDGARRIRMADGQTVLAYPANDARGRTWYAPVVICSDGASAMSLPWGRGDGGRACRRATPLQQQLIDVASQAAAEFESGAIAELPVDVGFEWAADLIEATHHISRETLLALPLLDDYLVVRLLLAACGLGTPEAPLEAVA